MARLTVCESTDTAQMVEMAGMAAVVDQVCPVVLVMPADRAAMVVMAATADILHLLAVLLAWGSIPGRIFAEVMAATAAMRVLAASGYLCHARAQEMVERRELQARQQDALFMMRTPLMARMTLTLVTQRRQPVPMARRAETVRICRGQVWLVGSSTVLNDLSILKRAKSSIA